MLRTDIGVRMSTADGNLSSIALKKRLMKSSRLFHSPLIHALVTRARLPMRGVLLEATDCSEVALLPFISRGVSLEFGVTQ